MLRTYRLMLAIPGLYNDMTTFKYTSDQLENPVGDNGLSARSKFFQRTMYREMIYPENLTVPIDTWYNKTLFGRVDRRQDTIIVRSDELVQISYALRPNMYCLNFVNDAFTKFVDHMRLANATQCLDPRGNSMFKDPKAILGYVNPTVEWNSRKSTVIQAFIKTFRENKQKPIINFNDFKDRFIRYLKIAASSLPITKTNYLLTNRVSPLISGLSIGIASSNAGNDAVKHTDYISDPNFSFFVAAAKKYGFTVNKNMPWILTADLFTSAIKRHLNLYLTGLGEPITEDNFFDVFYRRVYLDDLEDLSSLIVEAYNKFVTKKPLYQEEKIVYNPQCTNVFQVKNFSRTPLPPNFSLSIDSELIDLYIDIRNIESEYSAGDVSLIKKRARVLASDPAGLRIDRVLPYINNLYSKYRYPVNYDIINPDYLLDKTAGPDIIETSVDIAKAISGV